MNPSTEIPEQLPNAMPPMRPGDTAAAEYRGIGGWLSFFIIMNMYVGPALSVLVAVATLITYGTVFEETGPGFPPTTLLVLVSLIDVAAVVWGIIAAWRLNALMPHAVRFVKIWILANAAAGILAAIIMVVSGSPWNGGGTDGLLWAAVWYAYFTVSKRVKATYPDAGEPLIPSAG